MLNPALLNECRASFDWWQRLACSRRGFWLMFAWAAAEATFWPVIPDFLLVPMAAVYGRRFYVPLAAAVLGAALGGIINYLYSTIAPAQALDILRHIPLVSESQIDIVRANLARDGIMAYLYQPWSGVPFKVWAVVGGSMHLSPLLAIPTFVAARAFRMAVFATIAGLVGARFSIFLRDYWLFVLAIYVVLFSFGLWWVASSA
jgi:membrane protein YqaA with SNARE-associated domain